MTDWSAIVNQHGPMVWRTVYRLLDHDADAADCFQNAFLAAFEFTSASKVRNWCGLLKRLATVRALDRLRTRYRERNRQTTLPDSGVTGNHREASSLMEEAELAEHLRSALATLDERQAEVFCLACLEECSYREIADHLGISVNHVGVLLNRARAGLRELLEEYRPASGSHHHEQP